MTSSTARSIRRRRRDTFGWEARQSIENGLAMTWRWFAAQLTRERGGPPGPLRGEGAGGARAGRRSVPGVRCTSPRPATPSPASSWSRDPRAPRNSRRIGHSRGPSGMPREGVAALGLDPRSTFALCSRPGQAPARRPRGAAGARGRGGRSRARAGARRRRRRGSRQRASLRSAEAGTPGDRARQDLGCGRRPVRLASRRRREATGVGRVPLDRVRGVPAVDA